jgi:hypothetical protein
MRSGHSRDEIDSIQHRAAQSFDIGFSLLRGAATFSSKAFLAAIPTPAGTKVSRCSELKAGRELK